MASEAKPHDLLGLSVQTLTRDVADRLGMKGLPASWSPTWVPFTCRFPDEYDLEPEMLIVEVNREAVRNAKQYNQALAKAKQKGKVLLRCTPRTGPSSS